MFLLSNFASFTLTKAWRRFASCWQNFQGLGSLRSYQLSFHKSTYEGTLRNSELAHIFNIKGLTKIITVTLKNMVYYIYNGIELVISVLTNITI